jgi:hypothetical protein
MAGRALCESLHNTFHPTSVDPILAADTPQGFVALWAVHPERVMAYLSHLSYFSTSIVAALLAPLGATSKLYSKEGAQAYLVRWTGTAVVAFRGTEFLARRAASCSAAP